jgi:hypothetical protein
VSERELVNDFTDLIRSVSVANADPSGAAAPSVAAPAAARSGAMSTSPPNFSTPLGTPVKSSMSAAAAAAAAAKRRNSDENKLRLDSTSDSSELLSVSAADRAKFLSVRRAPFEALAAGSGGGGGTLGRSASGSHLIAPGPAAGSLVLSVLASTEGDRVDLTIDSPSFTAKDAIREVVLHLYGHIDERRHYGLATLDGALLGPAMPIVELFRAQQRRVRVVLVFPPDDESETADESLGVSLRDVYSLKGSLAYGASTKLPERPPIVKRSSSPDVASCITESTSSESSDSDSPKHRAASPVKIKRQQQQPQQQQPSPSLRRQQPQQQQPQQQSSGANMRAATPDPLIQRAIVGLAKVDKVIQDMQQEQSQSSSSQPQQAQSPLARREVPKVQAREKRSNSGGSSLLERKASKPSLLATIYETPTAPSPPPSLTAGGAVKPPPAVASPPPAAVHAPIAANTAQDQDGDGTSALLFLGASFDEVEICEFLGKGGSTSVYRGVVRGLSIAVKVFDLSFSDRRDRESVQREIGFMQTLRHRHIIGYLGVRQVEKTLYLYMEYFMATLHHLITKRRDASNVFDVSEVSTFAVQLARALKYLHTRSEPIIHRDLKSENVFIYRMTDKQYVLKLGDFGESTTVERKSIFHQRLMRSVCNVGTTEFRAPELWGKSKGYNTKVDIWAFGMVLFELITLDIPYRLEGLNRFAIPAYIAEGNRPQLPPETPPTFAPIVKLFNRCSEAAPSARPTAKELVASLDKLNRLFA